MLHHGFQTPGNRIKARGCRPSAFICVEMFGSPKPEFLSSLLKRNDKKLQLHVFSDIALFPSVVLINKTSH